MGEDDRIDLAWLKWKGTDLSGYTQRELNVIAHRRNTRLRKCLDSATPLEVYAQLRHHSPVALGT
jgi:IS30 family transposase